MNGVPSENVPVRINGFDVASGRETTGRPVMLGVAPTTHSLSRIEVLHTPTPESPGSALAGTVNLVGLSAFERSKPVFRSSAFVVWRDNEPITFERTPGPGQNPSPKVHPGFNFSYLRPVNDRFGFTLSGGVSRQYINHERMLTTWRGASAVTNGGTFPDTAPERPYLTNYSTGFFSVDSKRQSLAATVDYKLGPHDRLSVAFNYIKNDQGVFQRDIQFAITRIQPGDFSPTATRGFAGAGNIALANATRVPVDQGYTPTVTYRHDGPVWKADAGIGHSQNTNAVENASHGMFFNSNAARQNLTVAFDNISPLRPGTIAVNDGAGGAPINPYAIASYALNTASFHTRDALARGLNRVLAVQQGAYANLSREFSGRVPLVVKGGLDLRRQLKDLRTGGSTALTFVGADGRASQTPVGSDDSAAVVLDENNARVVPGFGFPPIEWVSNWKLYELYRNRPAWFTENESATHTSNANNSKRAAEIVSAGYLRGDLRLVEGRLRLVAGLRAEQTNVEAEGPLNDPTRNYQRDASGRVVRGPNGQPLPITTDALARARLTLVDRGLRAEKEYLRFFPSLNATFTVRENLLARAGYYQSVGRPNFNQYAGGVTLPDTEAADPSTQRITINNAGIKAWAARTAKLSLEQYFADVGMISIGAWRREIDHFFGSVVVRATPDFLALYGLDPAVYGRYDVATQQNLADTVRMEGVDVNYKQALTFLPHWARGVQVFANLSTVRALGPAEANFANAVPRILNGGVSLSRERFNVKLNWNYRSRNRLAAVAAGRGLAPDTFRWRASQTTFNFSGEYRLNPWLGFFATFNNAVRNDLEISGPDTPAYARLNQRIQYGGLWTTGVNSTF
jgi:TonB-dependent receptor